MLPPCSRGQTTIKVGLQLLCWSSKINIDSLRMATESGNSASVCVQLADIHLGQFWKAAIRTVSQKENSNSMVCLCFVSICLCVLLGYLPVCSSICWCLACTRCSAHHSLSKPNNGRKENSLLVAVLWGLWSKFAIDSKGILPKSMIFSWKMKKHKKIC